MAEISTPPAATASAVLRRALDLLEGRDVVAAIQQAAGSPHLADEAARALADYIGYPLDRAWVENIRTWQNYVPEYEIRRILPRAADHAEQEGR